LAPLAQIEGGHLEEQQETLLRLINESINKRI